MAPDRGCPAEVGQAQGEKAWGRTGAWGQEFVSFVTSSAFQVSTWKCQVANQIIQLDLGQCLVGAS